MAGRADQDHLVLEDRLEAHGPVTPRGADDAELEPSVGDEVDDRLRVVHLERDAEVGVALWNSQSSTGTTTAAGPVEAPIESSPVRAPRTVRGDLAEHLLLELQQALGAAVQAQSRLGRLHPPARAIEQLRPRRFSSARTCNETAGCVTPEPFSGLREAPPLDDGAERGELARVHKRSLSQDR